MSQNSASPQQSKAPEQQREQQQLQASLDALSKYPGGKLSKSEFSSMFGPIAREENRKSGIPASVTLAQAALETGWGGSSIGSAKNLFGIKGTGPAGTTIASTQEYGGGKYYTIRAGFRCYNTWLESIEDHSAVLQKSRYANAFKYSNDPDRFAAEIHKAGYATDKDYTSKLVSIMKGNNFYQWDVVSKPQAAAPAQAQEAAVKPAAQAPKNMTQAQLNAAVNYNKTRGYSKETWKKIQAIVGTGVDGLPGPKTAQAIFDWQSKHSDLVNDGQCGPKTLAKMNIKASNAPANNANQNANNANQNANNANQNANNANVPDGPSMTKQMSHGMYLSKYHIGLGNRNDERWRLHSKLQNKASQLDSLIAKEGLPFKLFEGMRSPARQQACKDNGASKLGAWYGRHNYGCAVDYVMKEGGNWSWDTGKNHIKKWRRLGELGRSVGLVWGGDWKTFVDMPHFELAGLPKTSKCKEIYQQSGIEGLWSQI